jgi:hypothetical protein
MQVPHFDRIVKRPHRIYAKEKIDNILIFLSQEYLPHGSLAQIAHQTGIPKQTLTRWRQIRIHPRTAHWRPYQGGHPNNRIFRDETEDAITDYIERNFINPGIGITRELLRTTCLNSFSSLEEEDLRYERFAASNGFLDDFAFRNGLSLRKPHVKRRTSPVREKINDFLERIGNMNEDYPPDRVFNFDETAWRFGMPINKVFAKKGSEAVNVILEEMPKEVLSVFATIAQNGAKLPLWICAKGKTDRCLSKFGYHPNSILVHTPNGWANEEIIAGYLEWLHNSVNQEPILLIWDMYPCHRSEAVMDKADQLDIEILFVPAGCTPTLQPLDRRIFGELKSRSRKDFRRNLSIQGMQQLTRGDSIGIIERCWSSISVENIKNAWNIC